MRDSLRNPPFKRLLLIAIFLTLTISLQPPTLADSDEEEDEDDDDGGDGEEYFGDLARVLLILTLLMMLWKPVLKHSRKHIPELLSVDKTKVRRYFNIADKWMRRIHPFLGGGAILTAIIHGLFANEDIRSAFVLWVAVGIMGLMAIAGSILQWKWPPKEVKKGAYLLHTQRLLSVVMVLLLVLGHEIVD